MRHDRGQRIMKERSGIGAVGKQLFQKREQAEQCGQKHDAAVAILDARRVDNRVQQQPLRIYEDMALFALDLLARIEPRRIDARPPFSADFTLWLSMMQAVGLASRPACSRHFR